MTEHFVRAWPDDPGGTAWFATGSYQLYARTPDHFVAVRAPITDVPRDVVVSGSFHKVSGPPGGGYGLIFGDQGVGAGDGIDQDGQFVVAEVGDRGQVGIWRRAGLRWVDIVPWTAAAAVRTDTGTNDLAIQLVGDRLVFQVNGSRVADFTVADMPRVGGVGIFTGGDSNQVAVEHFQVQQTERLAPASGSGNARSTSTSGRLPTPAADLHLQQPPPPPQAPQAGQAKPGVSLSGLQRVRELLGSIANDIAAIYASFADGIDSAHSPINDPGALRQAKAHFDSASRTASDLATELDKMGIHDGGVDGGH